MLAELLRADGAVVSAEQLLEKAWDEHADPFTNVRAGDRAQAAPQARRPAGDRDRAGSGVPDPHEDITDHPGPAHPVYGGLFLLAGLVLLGVTYVLVTSGSPHGLGFDLRRAAARSRARCPGHADQRRARPSACATIVRQVQDDARAATPCDSLLTQGGDRPGRGRRSPRSRSAGWSPAGCCSRCTRSPRPPAGSPARPAPTGACTSASRWPGPTDEVKELADTFDLMLDRLDRSFDGQRRFVANASHELRTPLTINRSLVELAMHPPGRLAGAAAARRDPAGDQRAARAADRRPAHCWPDSENELAERTDVDLADVAGHVAEQTRPVRRRSASTCSPTGRPDRRRPGAAGTARAEPGGERRPAQRRRRAAGSASPPAVVDGRATLTVSNTGPVVPGVRDRDALPAVPPAQPGTGRRQRGFGLGLSIVRAVARAHGGTVRAVPRPGGGLVVTVALPTAP